MKIINKFSGLVLLDSDLRTSELKIQVITLMVLYNLLWAFSSSAKIIEPSLICLH